MTLAYSELYIDVARDNLAVMLDYGVNVMGIDIDRFMMAFAGSRFGRGFESGNPAFVVGHSGIELALMLVEEVMPTAAALSYDEDNGGTGELVYSRSAEYWLGWALAYYQWKSNVRFITILQTVQASQMLLMYRKYHEMDVEHFCDRIDELRRGAGAESILVEKVPDRKESNLKTIRRFTGYTQRLLARQSGVPLRTIQQYEQRQKDINKAQAETVFALAKALGCKAGELLEQPRP